MLHLAARQWADSLEKISRRYAGQLVTLRQQESPEDLSDVVLWRTPLREVVTAQQAEGLDVTVRAGEIEPYIEIRLGLIQGIALRFDPENDLEAIHISAMDGSHSILLVAEDPRRADWL